MRKRRMFFLNTVVLTAGALILRFSGIAFRAWICVAVGTKGMGQFQLMMTVFMLAVTACTSGLGLAVTRTIAECRGGRREIRRCAGFAMCMSIVAGLGLWLGADFLSNTLLGGPETAMPLRLLAPGLPCMALASCVKGYFLAIRNTVLPAIGDIWEQFATIGLSVLLFSSMEPLNALCLGSSLGEAASCTYIIICYLLVSHKKKLMKKGPAKPRDLAHIAAPVLGGSMVRSGLSSAENLLVPRGLKLHGGSEAAALGQYGMMQGMVMPILYLPSSILTSASSLLIPELAEMNAKCRPQAIQRAAEKAVRLTLWYSFLITTLLIVFARPIGERFYNSAQAGEFLRVMAPIIPLLYLDGVVDGMLKGLDQQMYSFRYNFMDSILRVAMAAFLLPGFGIQAYFFLLFMSEIFNASLSINRLLKVTRLEVDAVTWVVTPAVAAALLYYLLELATKLFH